MKNLFIMAQILLVNHLIAPLKTKDDFDAARRDLRFIGFEIRLVDITNGFNDISVGTDSYYVHTLCSILLELTTTDKKCRWRSCEMTSPWACLELLEFKTVCQLKDILNQSFMHPTAFDGLSDLIQGIKRSCYDQSRIASRIDKYEEYEVGTRIRNLGNLELCIKKISRILNDIKAAISEVVDKDTNLPITD